MKQNLKQKEIWKGYLLKTKIASLLILIFFHLQKAFQKR
jgi:hypothetical protein